MSSPQFDKAIAIYKEVEKILSPAPVYLCGGCVRDMLLDKDPKDYDFATPLTPEEIEAKVRHAERKPYLIGARFGTIGFKVILPNEVIYVEVTTFRAEKYDEGNRKPNVEFVQDITADLSRRDFRMNAIAWRDGHFIDPFCGKLDLLERKIRCVGKPVDRIKEDPLRMLRCARFQAQLGFDVDEFLKSSIGNKSYKILQISKERWMQELDKLLLAPFVTKGLQFLADTRLLNFIIPEMALQINYDQNNPHHQYNLWNHTLKVVESTPSEINIRWAALLHDIAKPFVRTKKKDYSNYIHHDYLGSEIVEKTARYLKWSNERREKVKELVFGHLADNSPLKSFDNGAK